MSPNQCDAQTDVAPDGLLWCTREVGHPGMHRCAIWWYPMATLDYWCIECDRGAEGCMHQLPAADDAGREGT